MPVHFIPRPCSYDVRSGWGDAKLWSSPTVFANRAHFRDTTHPAQLVIDDLQLTDEGIYRCRADFQNSPTRNLKINFTVIGKKNAARRPPELPLILIDPVPPAQTSTEPPERPVIIESGSSGQAKLIEPYNEGSDVSLTCEVSGGEQ